MLFCIYTNPGAYPPLLHAIRILAEAGWEVLVLGTGSYDADALRLETGPGVRERRLPFASTGWKQKLNFVRFTLWVLAWVLRWRPSWVYASDAFACPAGLLASWMPGVAVAYHEHDSPPVEDARAAGTVLRLVWWTRRRLAGRARLNVLPQQERAEWFARTTRPSAPVVCVWNCPARREAATPTPPRRTDSLVVLYHGSIVPPRLPLAVVEALRELPDAVRLSVAGYRTIGAPTYVDELRARAAELGLADRVEVLGPLPRAALLDHARRCDVGLAFMPPSTDDINLRWMVGASNKPFDYMACGLALVVSPLPDWERTYVAPGYALAADSTDVRSVVRALRRMYDHPEERRRMGDAGRRRILDDWNYERQFAPVLEVLAERHARDTSVTDLALGATATSRET